MTGFEMYDKCKHSIKQLILIFICLYKKNQLRLPTVWIPIIDFTVNYQQLFLAIECQTDIHLSIYT